MEKIVPKNAIFGPNFPPPDTQCRLLLEVKQMPQWVVSSEVLTAHKVWVKVLFDHFQFCTILSDIHSYVFWEGDRAGSITYNPQTLPHYEVLIGN